MKIGIIGCGFVGGTTKEVLEKKHEIYAYDKYKPPFNDKKNLRDLAQDAKVCFICVPTPMMLSGQMDYSPIYGSVESLLENTREVNRKPEDILVTIRSTAVSGTTDALASKYPFKFAFNPEFLREKHALDDMLSTNRIIIGANDSESTKKMKEVYEPLFPDAKYIVVNRNTAEMIKYAANVSLTMQIAVANQIYQICQHSGVPYDVVKNTILMDERIGSNINVPGHDGDFGFGGKCFPKDLRALTFHARELGLEPSLFQAAWDLNLKIRKKKDWLDIPGATSSNNKFEQNSEISEK